MEKSMLIGKKLNQKTNAISVKNAGFSLLELVMVMFVIIILASIAMPIYQNTVQHARETVLHETLFSLRKQIDQYTADKGKLPKTLDDLVTEKYIREKPKDPISEQTEWDEILGEDPNSSEGEQGLVEIKSKSEGSDTEGKAYVDY
jgi:general secretion pathway protein G